MSKYYRKFNRAWLNSDRSKRAHLLWDVGYTYGTFSIGDCGRSITLDFQLDSLQNLRAGLRKIATLKRELEKFETALREAFEHDNG